MSTRCAVALIAALAENRVIGRDNRMPWHLPEDLRYFKTVTMGKPVIMGRKTWESLERPLPGRLNLVVTRDKAFAAPGAECFSSLESALQRARQWAQEQGGDEVMLIGGAQLYALALQEGLVERMYLTRVDLQPQGDAFFPEFTEAAWRLTCTTGRQVPESGSTAYSFEVWERC